MRLPLTSLNPSIDSQHFPILNLIKICRSLDRCFSCSITKVQNHELDAEQLNYVITSFTADKLSITSIICSGNKKDKEETMTFEGNMVRVPYLTIFFREILKQKHN